VILAGDVGATKILLEVGELRSGVWHALHSGRFAAADVTNFATVVTRFLEDWKEGTTSRARITAAAFGVAGPAVDNKVKMTHRPWAVDGDAIARRCGIPRVKVVNDLAAAACGIEWLGAKDMSTLIAGKAAPNEPSVVLGVGTGLGVAYLVPSGHGTRVLPGEGGHVGFSPASPEQMALFDAMHRHRGRVEAEDVVSGMGLTNLHEFLGHGRVDAEEIGTGAMQRKDPDCLATIELFTECLGTIAGDHALTVMARGGVYLGGGVIAKIAPLIKKERFGAAFCAKGAFSSVLMRIPVRIVTSERLVIFGAARCAMERSLLTT
jgi:glucokinase